jgi:hypothetical protein
VPRGGLALDADLVAGVLGYPCGAPPLYSRDVKLAGGRSGALRLLHFGADVVNHSGEMI